MIRLESVVISEAVSLPANGSSVVGFGNYLKITYQVIIGVRKMSEYAGQDVDLEVKNCLHGSLQPWMKVSNSAVKLLLILSRAIATEMIPKHSKISEEWKMLEVMSFKLLVLVNFKKKIHNLLSIKIQKRIFLQLE